MKKIMGFRFAVNNLKYTRHALFVNEWGDSFAFGSSRDVLIVRNQWIKSG